MSKFVRPAARATEKARRTIPQTIFMISSSLTDLVVANAMSSVQNPKRKWRVLDEYPWRKLGQSIAEASVGMSSANDGQVRDETNNLDALRIQMVSFE